MKFKDKLMKVTSSFREERPAEKAPTIKKQEGSSFKQFKDEVIMGIPSEIQNQRKVKTYKRAQFEALREEARNIPYELSKPPSKITHFAKGTTVFSYNAEGVRDFDWGCSWRTLQTCLSSYKIMPSLEALFHLFGTQKNLQSLYQNKYPGKVLPSTAAPYKHISGWGEPFIGQMALHFYSIPSTLECVNGLPQNCNSPKEAFSNPIDFAAFKERLINHFQAKIPSPVMIDDGHYAMSIVGIGLEGSNTILWIADPHIKEGVNRNPAKSPAGLYQVTLDAAGKQISSSLDLEDQHQLDKLLYLASYKGLHFEKKPWMVLFPKNL